MKIEHLAMWVHDLKGMKTFYQTYFGGRAGDRYHNPRKEFTSYFLSFSDGCRLELMHKTGISAPTPSENPPQSGLIHFAVSVGSKEQVDALTERLRTDGYSVLGEPRTTGDGYYESVVLDPEHNQIEITI
jgi:lactoylglutathione lyase